MYDSKQADNAPSRASRAPTPSTPLLTSVPASHSATATTATSNAAPSGQRPEWYDFDGVGTWTPRYPKSWWGMVNPANILDAQKEFEAPRNPDDREVPCYMGAVAKTRFLMSGGTVGQTVRQGVETVQQRAQQATEALSEVRIAVERGVEEARPAMQHAAESLQQLRETADETFHRVTTTSTILKMVGGGILFFGTLITLNWLLALPSIPWYLHAIGSGISGIISLWNIYNWTKSYQPTEIKALAWLNGTLMVTGAMIWFGTFLAGINALGAAEAAMHAQFTYLGVPFGWLMAKAVKEVRASLSAAGERVSGALSAPPPPSNSSGSSAVVAHSNR